MCHDRTREGSGRPTVSVGPQTDREEDTGTDTVTVGSQTDGMQETGGRIIETVDTQSKKRRSRLLQQSGQLLPGILDDITLYEITKKLPWTALQTLASVSHRWREAIHSRQVYDARVRCHSTETLVLLDSLRLTVGSLGLYSMLERSNYQLPPIPDVRETSAFMRSVSLDGKVYVLGGDSTLDRWGDFLGGDSTLDRWRDVNGTDVFVLDLAGSMDWKRCASMLEPRALFDCGVLDGKIYVFGGHYHGKHVGGSEMYDPKRNVWSSIQPMKYMRAGHHVVTVGDELFVYGGVGDKLYVYGEDVDGNLEVYHTVQKEWRLTERFGTHQLVETLFSAQGKLHMITTLGIYVHDTDSNSWRQRHSNSFPTLGPVDSISILLHGIVVENDQLLLGISLQRNIGGPNVLPGLLRSRGFGSEIKELVWEKVECSLVVGESMCSIQL